MPPTPEVITRIMATDTAVNIDENIYRNAAVNTEFNFSGSKSGSKDEHSKSANEQEKVSSLNSV